MKTKIIPWVMTWDGIVTKTHKYYLKELEIQPNIEAYMQSIVIKKTLESISFDYRRGEDTIEQIAESSEKVVDTVSVENVKQENPVETTK